jgi:hypothetical protein
MLKKYNRKLIHNMPKIVFPIKNSTVIINVGNAKEKQTSVKTEYQPKNKKINDIVMVENDNIENNTLSDDITGAEE